MLDLIVRCSELHRIMATPKFDSFFDEYKTDEYKEAHKSRKKTQDQIDMLKEASKNSLSVGGITYVKEKVKNLFLPKSRVETREMLKGTIVEDESIRLLNEYEFSSYTKNQERITKFNLTGECDIIHRSDCLEVKDIKSSWSCDTHPIFESDCKDHNWQLRGYMLLYGADKACTVHTLVDTPDHLLYDKDDRSVHKVSNIAVANRITYANKITKDLELEDLIISKVNACNRLYNKLLRDLEKRGFSAKLH